MAENGLDLNFVQDNHSFSPAARTLRGLHFQAPPFAQAKLVRCGRGAIYDVAVDIRRGSPSYGRWTGAELSFDNGWQMLIPEGFAHGFVTREPDTEIIYKCSAPYNRDAEGLIHFADPEIAIDWGIPSDQAILSEKDASAPLLENLSTPFSEEIAA